MTDTRQNDNNIIAQIVMFLLVFGLVTAANDNENHWSIRIACAAIAVVFPIALFFAVSGASFSNAGYITDYAWGFGLLCALLGLFFVGWFGLIVYECVESVSNANGWLVILTGIAFASLASYWLWTTEIGWWKILAIPAAYFMVCAFVEALFVKRVVDESKDTVREPSLRPSGVPSRSRVTAYVSIGLSVLLVVAVVAVVAVFSSLDSKSGEAPRNVRIESNVDENRAMSLELGEFYWPFVRDAIGKPSDTQFDADRYELIAVGLTAESAGVLTVYMNDYFVFFEAFSPDQKPVIEQTYAVRPRSARHELYEIMHDRRFTLVSIANGDFRDELLAQKFERSGG